MLQKGIVGASGSSFEELMGGGRVPVMPPPMIAMRGECWAVVTGRYDLFLSRRFAAATRHRYYNMLVGYRRIPKWVSKLLFLRLADRIDCGFPRASRDSRTQILGPALREWKSKVW